MDIADQSNDKGTASAPAAWRCSFKVNIGKRNAICSIGMCANTDMHVNRRPFVFVVYGFVDLSLHYKITSRCLGASSGLFASLALDMCIQ